MNKRPRDYHITINNIEHFIKVRGGDDIGGFLRSIVGGDNSDINILSSASSQNEGESDARFNMLRAEIRSV